MNSDQMYEHIRSQMRGTDVNALEALNNTLKMAGCELLPFIKGEKSLYVKCEGMPWQNVRIIEFLASANYLDVSIVALKSKDLSLDFIAVPYLRIGQKN